MAIYDQDTEEAQATTAQQIELARKTFVQDVRWMMSSPRGRRFVWWLLDKAGVDRTSFNNSGSVMAFNEGQRNMGLMVKAQVIEHCPEDFATMLDEQRKK